MSDYFGADSDRMREYTNRLDALRSQIDGVKARGQGIFDSVRAELMRESTKSDFYGPLKEIDEAVGTSVTVLDGVEDAITGQADDTNSTNISMGNTNDQASGHGRR